SARCNASIAPSRCWRAAPHSPPELCRAAAADVGASRTTASRLRLDAVDIDERPGVVQCRVPEGSVESMPLHEAVPIPYARFPMEFVMPETLTPLERRVYHYLLDFLAENTYQPSIRDICRRFKIKSTKSAADILQSLAEKGYIQRDGSRSRGVRLIGFRSEERRVGQC